MIQQTKRGYEEPTVRQLSIFLENHVGQLGEVLRKLEKREITVHAVSVADAVDFAVVRLFIDDPELAMDCLQEAGFAVSESRVIAVELPDERNGLLRMCRALLAAELNIHYAYPLLNRPRGHAVVLLRVDNPDVAVELLEQSELSILREGDFETDEEDVT